MKRATAIALMALALSACRDDNKQPTPQPAPRPSPSPVPTPMPHPQTGWQWVHPAAGSPCPLSANGAEATSFRFDGCEPHQLLRSTGPLSASSKVRMTWTCEGCSVRPVQGNNATVSLIIVRQGNNWQATDPNERWYWQGRPISPGESVEVPFDPGLWRNVFGQANASAFLDAIQRAQMIGLCFGDPGAGATCHGVRGSGRFSFTFSIQ